MTRQEFEKLTQVMVSEKEYEVIESMYMSCECDKFEFAKHWKEMNKSRVAKSIESEKEREAEESLKWELSNISNRKYTSNEFSKTLEEVFSKKELKLIEKAGIEFEENIYNPLFNKYFKAQKSVSSVLYEIKERISK